MRECLTRLNPNFYFVTETLHAFVCFNEAMLVNVHLLPQPSVFFSLSAGYFTLWAAIAAPAEFYLIVALFASYFFFLKKTIAMKNSVAIRLISTFILLDSLINYCLIFAISLLLGFNVRINCYLSCLGYLIYSTNCAVVFESTIVVVQTASTLIIAEINCS